MTPILLACLVFVVYISRKDASERKEKVRKWREEEERKYGR